MLPPLFRVVSYNNLNEMVSDSLSKLMSLLDGFTSYAVARVGGVNVDDVIKETVIHLNVLDGRSTPSGVARTELETTVLVDTNTYLRVGTNVAVDIVCTAEGVDMHSSLLSCSIQNEGLYGNCTPSATRSPLGWTVRRTLRTIKTESESREALIISLALEQLIQPLLEIVVDKLIKRLGDVKSCHLVPQIHYRVSRVNGSGTS